MAALVALNSGVVLLLSAVGDGSVWARTQDKLTPALSESPDECPEFDTCVSFVVNEVFVNVSPVPFPGRPPGYSTWARTFPQPQPHHDRLALHTSPPGLSLSFPHRAFQHLASCRQSHLRCCFGGRSGDVKLEVGSHRALQEAGGRQAASRSANRQL